MYLLLNDNKYLDQIVNSVFFCLNKNEISCKMVEKIEKIENSNKSGENFNNIINNDSSNIINELPTNPKKNLSNISQKSNLLKISENNNTVTSSKLDKNVNIYQLSINNNNNKNNSTFKLDKNVNIKDLSMNKDIKNNSDFNIKDILDNPVYQKNKLPTSFDLSSIAFDTTGVKTNFTKTNVKENSTKNNKNGNISDNKIGNISDDKKINNLDNSKMHNVKKDVNEIDNIKNDVVEKDDVENDVYIIFNINSIDEDNLPKKFIVYNFEQLTTNRKWDYSFFKKCKKALLVLDYSLENIKILEQRGIEAYHLPFGYCSIFEPSYNLQKKNIDILFLGSLNENRLNTITDISLINSKSNIYIHNKCFKDEFEKVTCSSKIGLNIHYYEGKTILELTRIIPLVCAGVLVVSERSNDIFYDKIFNKIIRFCKKEELATVIKEEVYKYDINYALKKKKKLKKILNFEKIIKENIGIFKKFI